MTPEDIVRSPGLTKAQKISRLTDLARDAAEQAVALEEGMPGEESDLLHRAQKALRDLGVEFDPERSSPAKHHVGHGSRSPKKS